MDNDFRQVQNWQTLLSVSCQLDTLRIIDEFEQLIESEKKQIILWVDQLLQYRKKLIIQFNKYKDSHNYSGDTQDQHQLIFHSNASQFFKGYSQQIQQIIRNLGNNPQLLARIIASKKNHKLDIELFAQNIMYHLYPFYLPDMVNNSTPNNCLLFIEEIINLWNYDVVHGKPKQYSIIDQIISGFNRTPEIVTYTERISTVFMNEMSRCVMSVWVFDEEQITKQLEDQGIAQSDQISQCDNLMKYRQQQFSSLITKTIQIILHSQIPKFLYHMMRFFHKKIKKLLDTYEQNTIKKNAKNLQLINKSGIIPDYNGMEQLSFYSIIQGRQIRYYIHYCYFLMTNLIFVQLHKKFTILHQDTGISPEMFQNYNQVITIITQIFQGKIPKSKKYKDQQLKNLGNWRSKVCQFYANFVNQFQDTTQKVQKKFLLSAKSKQIRQILLKLHQNTLILSFGDIRTLLSITNSSPSLKQLKLSQKAQKMQFLKEQKISSIFSPFVKKVQNIFFIFHSHQPSISSIIQYYINNQFPLKNMPKLTHLLQYGNQSTTFASNLQLNSALQIIKCLQLISSLSLAEVKYFISKLFVHFNSSLFLQHNQIFIKLIQQTIYDDFRIKTQRKALFLLERGEIYSNMTSVSKIIQLCIEQVRSNQLYDRVSETYIQNTKIKAFLRIQNDELKIYQNANQMKGINLQSLLVTDVESKSKKTVSQQYILRNSFKFFTSIPQIVQSLANNKITRLALGFGRRCEQFNEMFVKLCSISTFFIDQHIKKRKILKNLNKQKLTKTVVSQIQDYIFLKYKLMMIQCEGWENAFKLIKGAVVGKEENRHKWFFSKAFSRIECRLEFFERIDKIEIQINDKLSIHNAKSSTI